MGVVIKGAWQVLSLGGPLLGQILGGNRERRFGVTYMGKNIIRASEITTCSKSEKFGVQITVIYSSPSII